MFQKIINTKSDWTGTILRLTLGIVLFAHGAQKALGLFGGYGFSGTMGYFTGTVGLPWIVAFLVIIIEFIGSLALILGFTSRIWSALIIVLMLGIILTAHLPNGFFMNWYGTNAGEGYEYHVLAIGLALGLIATGSGKLSIDAQLMAE